MQALGLIETRGLIAAVESADAMLKAANVRLVEKTLVGGGLVSIAVTGDVGAVKAAVEAGEAAVKQLNSALLISQHVIPRPHQELEDVMVTATSLKNIEISIVTSEKAEPDKEDDAEEIAEGTVVNHYDLNEDTVENAVDSGDEISEKPVESGEEIVDNPIDSKEEMVENPVNPKEDIVENLGELNKEAVDKMILEYGLEGTIVKLNKLKVVKLRNLAREYKEFGISGRQVSKANKQKLIEGFRQYYGED